MGQAENYDYTKGCKSLLRRGATARERIFQVFFQDFGSVEGASTGKSEISDLLSTWLT